MSYLTIPRLVFTGGYQADVSTVNNDVRHYDNETFESRFQLPSDGNVMNGWWNPDGTGSFRFFDLQIRQAIAYPRADPTQDPATGLYLNPQERRSSAKMVDLDPQMQVVSTIFGLRFVLTDGEHTYFSGDYKPVPFRDLFMTQARARSAIFTSVLSNLEWNERAGSSATLTALKSAADANDGKLSINFMTYANGPRATGLLIGAIGTHQQGQPEEYVAARRLNFAPSSTPGADETFGDLAADVDATGTMLSLDLANSIPSFTGDFGELYTAILRDTDQITGFGTPAARIDVGIKQGETVSETQLKLLSQIDYSEQGWLQATAGIVDNELDAEAQALVAANQESNGLFSSHPVAIVKKTGAGQYKVLIRETHGGLYLRADQFVYRVDPPVSGTIETHVAFKVSQWGQSLVGAPIVLGLEDEQVSGKYWGPGPATDPNPPKAQYPEINTPAAAVGYPRAVVSDDSGWARVPLELSNPGDPRNYVDGQIYTMKYHLGIQNASPQAPFDMVVVHARTAVEYSNPPDWDTDIAPFMQQYDNLYPIMSKHLFSLSDPDVFKKNASLLSLAFSLPESDPNHMPVTRDLSRAKRQAVLNWLAYHSGEAAPELRSDEPQVVPAAYPSAPRVLSDDEAAALPEATEHGVEFYESMLNTVEEGIGGKDPMIRNFLMHEIDRLKSNGNKD